MTKRILITGSRNWADRYTLEKALANEVLATDHDDIVFVSGNCPSGADRMAEEWAEVNGYPVELHPADWERLGKRAGPMRNLEMVQAGADVCLAFLTPESKGGAKTAQWAEEAGVPTVRFYAE